MRYIKPDYYDEFKCVAAACPDTCCAGWQIVIDEESLEKYSKAEGAFGRRLVNCIDWQEGCFYQYGRRCAFLNEENLCDLYTELGEGALCATCRNYPRHTEEYEGLRELSLSLSCPVAARMILTQERFPEFVEFEDEREEELAEEFEDFDLLMFTQLEDARTAVLKHLRGVKDDGGKEQQPRVMADDGKEQQLGTTEGNGKTRQSGAAAGNLEEKMCTFLEFAREMQTCIDSEEYFQMDTVIRAFEERMEAGGQAVGVGLERDRLYIASTEAKSSQTQINSRFSHRKTLYTHIYSLERLRDEWTQVLEEMDATLYQSGREQYEEIVERFDGTIALDEEAAKCWENAGLQLFVFFLYTYFCGAVYDDRIYGKMALAVESVRFIRELYLAKWVQSGELTETDYVEFAYRYAREIEHSDINLNALEDFLESED